MKKYTALLLLMGFQSFFTTSNCERYQGSAARPPQPSQKPRVITSKPQQSSTKNITKKLVYASADDVVQNLTDTVQPEAARTIGKSSMQGQASLENTKPFSPVSNESDSTRFQTIKVDADTASNEVDFWARQMSEHALFAHLGLEDPDLKEAALQTHVKLEDFRKQFNANPLDLRLMNKILPLLKAEREFQIKLLQTLDAGKWIGWIFPLFINHITLELDYFVDKLNGIKYTPQQELLFWNRINSEHAAFASHLLDPSERELFLKADDFHVKLMDLPKSEREMMMNISLKYSKELDQFFKTAEENAQTIKSIIHPVLLRHVIREGERSIATLQNLGLYKESAAFEQQYAQQVKEYMQPAQDMEEEIDFEMESAY